MKPWGNAEWYPVLVKGKGLTFVGSWVLCPTSESEVELVSLSGEMARAAIDPDGVCRVRAEPGVLPLPDEVVQTLRTYFNLD